MANSAKDIQMRELRDTIAQLNELVKTLQETLKQVNALNTQVTQERDNLKEQVDYLTKKLFGTSSEKRSHNIPGQLEMFNEAEQLQDPVLAKEEDAEAAAPVPKKRRSRATDEERYKGIRVEKVYLDVPDDQKTCSVCGTQMKAIGTEFVRRELDFIPAKVKVVEYYTINYACPSCKENSAAAQIERGKDYHPRLMHGMASPAVIAWPMYQKYSNSVPLYRPSMVQKSAGQLLQTGLSGMPKISLPPCTITYIGSCSAADFLWQMKHLSRSSTNPTEDHRQNLTCGYSEPGRMMDRH